MFSTATDTAIHAALLIIALGVSPVAYGGNVRGSITTPDGKPVADAVLVVTPEDVAAAAAPSPSDVVDQVDKQFVPYVNPIVVGSEVHFPNKDNIRHQVYSFSPAKRFELPLYSGTPAQPVLFDKPGVITLGCNIHDWMIGYIYVSESPWFAKSAEDGMALIAGVPAGRYKARIWHPQMVGTEQDTVREITVDESGNLELTWQIVSKPELRPRRAPVGGEQGYH